MPLVRVKWLFCMQNKHKFLKKVLTRVGAALNMRPVLEWGYSSAGRALAWHARGQRFDPVYLHQSLSNADNVALFLEGYVPFV